MVLMDIQMPRMDGVEATRRIRGAGGTRSRVPIIALTAHAIASERDSYLSAGMDDYLTKPFEPHQLAELLDRWTPTGSTVAEREAAPPAPVADTLLDEARLAELAGIMTEERFSALVEAWVESAKELAEKLDAEAEAGNAAALAVEAHKLTGSAANFGAKALAALARRIEADARIGNTAAARSLTAEVNTLYRDTVAAMRMRRTQQQPPPERLAAG
jgi:CheY-like chemotaxis protein